MLYLCSIYRLVLVCCGYGTEKTVGGLMPNELVVVLVSHHKAPPLIQPAGYLFKMTPGCI